MAVLSTLGSDRNAAATRVAIGRSGRRYGITAIDRNAGVAGEDVLYALASGLSSGLFWGWVGSARDLIDDPESRSRFKAFSAAGGSLYRLDDLYDPLERMTVAWDIEGMDADARRSAA